MVVCADGLSAFREESLRRAYGDWSAVAVYSVDGVRWWAVCADSVLRPDPAPPPPQAVWWAGGWFWRAGNRSLFSRRRPRGGTGLPVPGYSNSRASEGETWLTWIRRWLSSGRTPG